MSQTEFANAVGLSSHTACSKWERGLASPDDQTLEKIALLVGKSIEWLLSDQGEHGDRASSWTQLILRASVLPISQWHSELGQEDALGLVRLSAALAEVYGCDLLQGIEHLKASVEDTDSDFSARELIRAFHRLRQSSSDQEQVIDHFESLREMRELKKLLKEVIHAQQ